MQPEVPRWLQHGRCHERRHPSVTRASLLRLRTHGLQLTAKVRFGGDRIILQHRGKAVAALIPVEDLRLLEELEDEYWIRRADEAEAEPGPNVPFEQVKRELGL
jgi:antitoxin (DNA-binding transcriptional repressor) of toxin-antitoxin stability system